MLLTNLNILKKILKLKVNILYLPVTLIRIIKALHGNLKIKNNFLKTLGSMGEPLAENVGKWYSSAFGLSRKAIVNTYFQFNLHRPHPGRWAWSFGWNLRNMSTAGWQAFTLTYSSPGNFHVCRTY